MPLDKLLSAEAGAITWASSAVKDLWARVLFLCEGDCTDPVPAAAAITAAAAHQGGLKFSARHALCDEAAGSGQPKLARGMCMGTMAGGLLKTQRDAPSSRRFSILRLASSSLSSDSPRKAARPLCPLAAARSAAVTGGWPGLSVLSSATFA